MSTTAGALTTSASGGDKSSLVDYEFQIGEKLECFWDLHQSYQPIEIIERRQSKNQEVTVKMNRTRSAVSNATVTEYYVHFEGYDRRLDEWVSPSQIKKLIPKKKPESESNNSESNSTKRGVVTRRDSKRKFDEMAKSGHSDTTTGGHTHGHTDSTTTGGHTHLAAIEADIEEITKVKNLNTIEIGQYQVDTWYYSPYPDEYCVDKTLYLCEFCLKYMRKRKSMQRHKVKCPWKHPPGVEIYRKGNICVFEVDGSTNKIYCQNLCLLAKLFLDHKTLYYDVDPFLFYVVTEVDQSGYHAVGYFSKEKVSEQEYNLACILTFPPYQRKGYGKFLISLSYELSKVEDKTGSPEKPLSDLGKLSYRSYWTFVLMNMLREYKTSLSIRDIGRKTGFKNADIISTLQSLDLIKYWKGQHIISVSEKIIDDHLLKFHRKMILCDPNFLNWKPKVEPAGSKKKK